MPSTKLSRSQRIDADRHALRTLLSHSQAPVIGIAGTSGKSTTAAVVRTMLRLAGHRVSASAPAALQRLDRLTNRDRVVVELPWQIARGADGLSVVGITGLASDELEPGISMGDLTSALRPAVASARRAVVVNATDAQCLALATAAEAPVRHAATGDRSAAAALVDGTVILNADGVHRPVCRIEDTGFAVGGLATDLLVAAAVATAAGARIGDVRRAALQFEPPSDHHEVVGERDGVTWINDAAATRPGRTAATLAGYPSRVLLLAGGQYGEQPLWRWAQVAAARASRVLMFDTGAVELAEALSAVDAVDRIVRCADLDDATAVARRLAMPGDTVLLSPACAPGAEPAPGSRFRHLVGPLTHQEAA